MVMICDKVEYSRKSTNIMFYTFNQNNSGGSFDFDKARGITHYVIIEANSVEHANKLVDIVVLTVI